MLKTYNVLTKVDAFFLSSTTDRGFIKDFFNVIPHSINDEGVTIVHPDGEDLIEFNKFYLMFDVGSGQLLSIEKDKFEESATEIMEGVDNAETATRH